MQVQQSYFSPSLNSPNYPIGNVNFEECPNLYNNMSRDLVPITDINKIINANNNITNTNTNTNNNTNNTNNNNNKRNNKRCSRDNVKAERYFVICKRLHSNLLNEVLMFDMNKLELYIIEFSMQFLEEKYPDFMHHFFVLVTESGYEAYDQNCNHISDINQVVKLNSNEEEQEEVEEEDYDSGYEVEDEYVVDFNLEGEEGEDVGAEFQVQNYNNNNNRDEITSDYDTYSNTTSDNDLQQDQGSLIAEVSTIGDTLESTTL